MDPRAPGQVVEHFFRHESGRLTTLLVRVLGAEQIDLAEEIVQETLLVALGRWQYGELPDNPAAWLTRVARNLALDRLRRGRTQARLAAELERALPEDAAGQPVHFADEVADDTLRMMFTCCSEALTPAAQIALILKCLCGFSVREIAAALLASPDAVERRLSRAKAVVRHSGLVEVTAELMLARIDAVHGAIYSLFSEGFHGSYTDEVVRGELCGEALRLARLLADHPRVDHPGSDALVALICLHAARLPARLTPEGELITLRYQDRGRWDRSLLAEGMARLARCARGASLTRLHLEAGLAATHAAAGSWAQTDWGRIVDIYDALEGVAPGPVVALNRAIAVGWRDGAEAGLLALEAIDDAKLRRYPFAPAARAEFLAELGRKDEARVAFEAALKLARNGQERRFLRQRREALR